MTLRKFGFLSKKKLMVEKNSGSHKTLNWQKINELGVFWLIFSFSSGELTETNVQAEI